MYIYNDEDNAPMSDHLSEFDFHNPTVYGSRAEMMTKIREYPFCGSENVSPRVGITEDGNYATYTVLCSDCGIGIFRARQSADKWNAYKSIQEAIDAWNMRIGGNES